MIIVTGGAGFIGSNIVKGLNQDGITNIIIVDNLSKSEKHKNLNRLQFKDYIDKDDFKIEDILKYGKISAIFHQGACSNTMESDGKYMMKNNYEYSKRLLEAAISNNIDLIYASSASVYGNGEKGFKEEPKCEYPLNIYAFSKYQFDRYVSSLLPKVSSQIVGLRYFNVYGPQENHKNNMASVAYHMYNKVKLGLSMELFEGSENFKRDFIYIDDVVSVNKFFYYNKNKSGIYNCGTGTAESFCDIAKSLQDLYPKAKIEKIPFPEKLVNKYQKFTRADDKKLRASGYTKEFITLDKGIKLYTKVLEESEGYLM